MRRKLVVGNWKMNLTVAEAAATVEGFINHLCYEDQVDIGVCPSYVSIFKVRDLIRNTSIKLGAQDVFWKESGAFTGRVSAPMLRDAGCSLCIVGHSETRGKFGKLEVEETTLGYFSDTDETVNLKVKALLYHSIEPIICVGETLGEREAGRTDDTVQSQLRAGLKGIDSDEFYAGVIAYEPVWAIGTGRVCDAAEAERVCALIRSTLATLMNQDVAQAVRILYGGSVKANNARELFHQPNIDGGLVGGGSLNSHEFCEIVRAAR